MNDSDLVTKRLDDMTVKKTLQPCCSTVYSPGLTAEHAALHHRGALARQLPLILPTHHPLGTRQQGNI